MILSAIALALHCRLDGLRVVIDCGHGGSDPGMEFQYGGHTYHEAAITYQEGIRLRKHLRSAGIDVAMTTDSPRAEKARNCLTLPSDAHYTVKPEIRVHAGVHGCSIRADGWTGRQTILISLHVDDPPNHSTPSGGTLYQGLCDRKPCSFTVCLNRRLRTAHLTSQTSANPAVCSWEDLFIYNCPSAKNLKEKVLYEMGCPKISTHDAWLLTSSEGKERIATAITDAVLAWKAAHPS